LIIQAVRQALEEAETSPDSIDLLVYSGVSKGFLEPASAYLVAQALDLACECFDVGDACMGWLRAMDIANVFLRDGRYRHILIVNAECGYYEHGYPELLCIKSFEQLKYTLPAFGVGEAVTATLVRGSDALWNIAFSSMPQHVGLCGIPLRGYEEYAGPGEFCLNGLEMLYARGAEMVTLGTHGIVTLVRSRMEDIGKPRIWFPHVVSVDAAKATGRALSVDEALVYVDSFRAHANVVSASIPLAIKMATDSGALRRGDVAAVCVASAGMACGMAEFVF